MCPPASRAPPLHRGVARCAPGGPQPAPPRKPRLPEGRQPSRRSPSLWGLATVRLRRPCEARSGLQAPLRYARASAHSPARNSMPILPIIDANVVVTLIAEIGTAIVPAMSRTHARRIGAPTGRRYRLRFPARCASSLRLSLARPGRYACFEIRAGELATRSHRSATPSARPAPRPHGLAPPSRARP